MINPCPDKSGAGVIIRHRLFWFKLLFLGNEQPIAYLYAVETRPQLFPREGKNFV